MEEEVRKDKPKEELIVYEMVRNSIVSCEERVRNETIYMYVTYFTMLSFGFTYNWLFLVTFIVLVTFQSMINCDRLAVEKASAYIRVFFEESGYNIHWESLHKDMDFLSVYDAQAKNLGWYFNTSSSSILAIISFISMLGSSYKAQGFDYLLHGKAIELAVGFIVCLIVIYIIGWYYDTSSSSILAVISFVSMLVAFLKAQGFDYLPQNKAIELTVGFILCMIAINTNRKFFVNRGIKTDPINKSIEEYYTKCYPSLPNTTPSQNSQQKP